MKLEPPADLNYSSFEYACRMLGVLPESALALVPETLVEAGVSIQLKYNCEVRLMDTDFFPSKSSWAVLSLPHFTGSVVSIMPD